jgi:hypothetical protein
MSVYDLINPMNLRRAIKSTFTGDASELVAEMLQNAQRAGARNVQFTTVDEGFTYLDDGRGLRDIADFEAIVRLGDSGWEQYIQTGQRPMGLGAHSILAHDEIGSVTFASGSTALTIQTKPWWEDPEYASNWRNYLRQLDFPIPGMCINVACSNELSNKLVEVLTYKWCSSRSPARGYFDLLKVSINGTDVETSVPDSALPKITLLETSYQGNRLVIGFQGEDSYQNSPWIWVNWYGQMIPVTQYGFFQAYLEVRSGRPVNPMSPTRRGIIVDEALKNLQDFIRDALTKYFTETPIDKINAFALHDFYRSYPEQARVLPYFVASRRKDYKPGIDKGELNGLYPPQVFSYARPPLLLADEIQVFDENKNISSCNYGLHSFLKLTGKGCKVLEGDNSRLDIRRLWWKPGPQIALPAGCSTIFHETGQWGLSTMCELPLEWRNVGNRVVFAFNRSSAQGVTDVDFIVGGADPRKFYQAFAWAGFDRKSANGSDDEEKANGYRESCEREARKIIGNAVPKNFSLDDLSRFVRGDRRIVRIAFEYRNGHDQQPAAVRLLLSDKQKIRLKLF